MPAYQEMSLEMHALHSVQESSELQDMALESRQYEFECGFGVPLLKKYRAHKLSHDAAQSPQTRQTPETLKRL